MYLICMYDRMSDLSGSPGKGGNNKRNLPSWMSSRQKLKNDGGENQKQAEGGGEARSEENDNFSKLLVLQHCIVLLPFFS